MALPFGAQDSEVAGHLTSSQGFLKAMAALVWSQEDTFMEDAELVENSDAAHSTPQHLEQPSASRHGRRGTGNEREDQGESHNEMEVEIEG